MIARISIRHTIHLRPCPILGEYYNYLGQATYTNILKFI